MEPDESSITPRPRRRPRYSGKNPRHFKDKYKEIRGDTETVEKVLAGGKTPAGTHRPIMVEEILEILHPAPGEKAVDCTLGYGGHAEEILKRIQPGGMLLGLDRDPLEQARTETRLRGLGYCPNSLVIRQSNFAGLSKALTQLEWNGADMMLADLGVSSMQLDNPDRGFSFKVNAPLDMRMNPQSGLSAREWILKKSADDLAKMFHENADEPMAEKWAAQLAGKDFPTTRTLVTALCEKDQDRTLHESTIRRIFQALRIAVNDEFGSLDALLRQLPASIANGGRICILSFHSGEDRRVKKSFREGLEKGVYHAISPDVLRPAPEEQRNNPRSTSAKLRWAIKG